MMDRPIFRVTVTSSAGWTYSTTQGVEAPAADTWIVDTFTYDWSFTQGVFPGQLDPDVVTFTLHTKAADVLPSADQGDIITVSLVRPGPADVDLVYVSGVGRITDVDLDQVPRVGLFLTLTVADFKADANQATIPAGVLPAVNNTAGNRVADIARLAAVNVAYQATFGGVIYAAAALPVDGDNVVEVLAAATAGTFNGQWGLIRPVDRPESTPDGYDVLDVNDLGKPYALLVQPVPAQVLVDELPFTLDRPAGTTVIVKSPTAETNDQLLVLSAGKVRVGSKRHKSREHAVNRYTTKSVPNGPVDHWDLRAQVDRIGVIEQSQTIHYKSQNGASEQAHDWPASTAGTGGRYPNQHAAAGGWSLPALTITVDERTFTDAELDHYAPMFYPAADDTSTDPVVGRPIAVVDIDEDVNVDGAAAVGTIVGGKFTINAGELTIEPVISPQRPRYSTDATSYQPSSITWAQLAADPVLASTTWATIAPTMTAADLALVQI